MRHPGVKRVLTLLIKKIMSTKVWLILCFIFIGPYLFGQKVYNYDKNGHRLKTAAEFVDVGMTNTPPEGTAGTESVIGGILLGPVYNIISSTIKEQLKKREQKFIGTYSNSTAFSYDDFKQKGDKTIFIRRYAIDIMPEIDSSHLAAEYELPVTVDNESITIALGSILLKRTKAKYKSRDKLSISIHVAANNVAENNPPLGEGTIVVPVYKLTGEPQDLSLYEDKINKIVLPNPGLSEPGNLKLSISVTETNISRLDPSRVQELISNNSEDLRTILKTALGL